MHCHYKQMTKRYLVLQIILHAVMCYIYHSEKLYIFIIDILDIIVFVIKAYILS